MRAGTVVRVLLVEDDVRLADAEGFQVELEVYVGYLRKKIDAPFGLHIIETVRGVGYRLLGECGKR